MHSSVMLFGKKNILLEDIQGKKVLEVGSYDMNGSLRPHIEGLKPASYTGVDIRNGPRVDLLLDATELINYYGLEAFDFVLCTEVLEHVSSFGSVLHSIKSVLRVGGTLLLTTRSPGFWRHNEPIDCWRFTLGDIQRLFADFTILTLQSDPEIPGVLLKAKKPADFNEISYEDITISGVI